MVREAPAAWSCFFILHIISNPDTQKKTPPGLSTQLCAPLEFGGFVQRLHIPDQSHPPCWGFAEQGGLDDESWSLFKLLRRVEISSPEQGTGSEGMSLLMTHRVANIPTVNTHPPPLPPHYSILVFVSLSAPSHLHGLLVVVGFVCVSVCVSQTPHPTVQLAAGIGSGEKRGNARN